MTPAVSSARTRSAHGVALRPTVLAKATIGTRPSRCSASRMARSMLSSVFIAGSWCPSLGAGANRGFGRGQVFQGKADGLEHGNLLAVRTTGMSAARQVTQLGGNPARVD